MQDLGKGTHVGTVILSALYCFFICVILLIITGLRGKRNVKLRVFPYVNEMLTKKCKNLCATYCKTDINMLSLRKQLRDMESKSWVVISKETGEAVLETFDRKVADAVNTKKYTVKPILEHLQSLNAVNA